MPAEIAGAVQGNNGWGLAAYRGPAPPAGSNVEDWPFGYDELEPYYDRVGDIDSRGNRFEGPRQREFPTPHASWDGTPSRAQQP